MHLGEVLSSQQLFLFARHFTLIHFTLTSRPQKLLLLATDTTSLRTREGVR